MASALKKRKHCKEKLCGRWAIDPETFIKTKQTKNHQKTMPGNHWKALLNTFHLEKSVISCGRDRHLDDFYVGLY